MPTPSPRKTPGCRDEAKVADLGPGLVLGASHRESENVIQRRNQ
jgi:hypothetical protein